MARIVDNTDNVSAMQIIRPREFEIERIVIGMFIRFIIVTVCRSRAEVEYITIERSETLRVVKRNFGGALGRHYRGSAARGISASTFTFRTQAANRPGTSASANVPRAIAAPTA